MRGPLLRGILYVALVAVTTVGCGSDSTTPPPTTPTPTPVTETFTGKLTVNGAVTFAPIAIASAGSANLKLTGLAPDGAAVVGIALGTWSGTTCTIVLANDIAGVGGLVTGVVQGAGSLCARVYDVGKLTDATDFTIDVTHF